MSLESLLDNFDLAPGFEYPPRRLEQEPTSGGQDPERLSITHAIFDVPKGFAFTKQIEGLAKNSIILNEPSIEEVAKVRKTNPEARVSYWFLRSSSPRELRTFLRKLERMGFVDLLVIECPKANRAHKFVKRIKFVLSSTTGTEKESFAKSFPFTSTLLDPMDAAIPQAGEQDYTPVRIALSAIIDTIAWSNLPIELFKLLFRGGVGVSSTFRNYLLAKRLYGEDAEMSTTPGLPDLHRSFMWEEWDHVARATRSGEGAEAAHSFFDGHLGDFENWLETGLFRRSPKEILPIIFRSFLTRTHHPAALRLLSRYADTGTEAVEALVDVGITPSIQKLVESGDGKTLPHLLFIWSKLIAHDSDQIPPNRKIIDMLIDIARDSQSLDTVAVCLYIIANYEGGRYMSGKECFLVSDTDAEFAFDMLKKVEGAKHSWKTSESGLKLRGRGQEVALESLCHIVRFLWWCKKKFKFRAFQLGVTDLLLPRLLKHKNPSIRAAAAQSLVSFVHDLDSKDDSPGHVSLFEDSSEDSSDFFDLLPLSLDTQSGLENDDSQLMWTERVRSSLLTRVLEMKDESSPLVRRALLALGRDILALLDEKREASRFVDEMYSDVEVNRKLIKDFVDEVERLQSVQPRLCDDPFLVFRRSYSQGRILDARASSEVSHLRRNMTKEKKTGAVKMLLADERRSIAHVDLVGLGIEEMPLIVHRRLNPRSALFVTKTNPSIHNLKRHKTGNVISVRLQGSLPKARGRISKHIGVLNETNSFPLYYILILDGKEVWVLDSSFDLATNFRIPSSEPLLSFQAGSLLGFRSPTGLLLWDPVMEKSSPYACHGGTQKMSAQQLEAISVYDQRILCLQSPTKITALDRSGGGYTEVLEADREILSFTRDGAMLNVLHRGRMSFYDIRKADEVIRSFEFDAGPSTKCRVHENRRALATLEKRPGEYKDVVRIYDFDGSVAGGFSVSRGHGSLTFKLHPYSNTFILGYSDRLYHGAY